MCYSIDNELISSIYMEVNDYMKKKLICMLTVASMMSGLLTGCGSSKDITFDKLRSNMSYTEVNVLSGNTTADCNLDLKFTNTGDDFIKMQETAFNSLGFSLEDNVNVAYYTTSELSSISKDGNEHNIVTNTGSFNSNVPSINSIYNDEDGNCGLNNYYEMYIKDGYSYFLPAKDGDWYYASQESLGEDTGDASTSQYGMLASNMFAFFNSLAVKGYDNCFTITETNNVVTVKADFVFDAAMYKALTSEDLDFLRNAFNSTTIGGSLSLLYTSFELFGDDYDMKVPVNITVQLDDISNKVASAYRLKSIKGTISSDLDTSYAHDTLVSKLKNSSFEQFSNYTFDLGIVFNNNITFDVNCEYKEVTVDLPTDVTTNAINLTDYAQAMADAKASDDAGAEHGVYDYSGLNDEWPVFIDGSNTRLYTVFDYADQSMYSFIMPDSFSVDKEFSDEHEMIFKNGTSVVDISCVVPSDVLVCLTDDYPEEYSEYVGQCTELDSVITESMDGLTPEQQNIMKFRVFKNTAGDYTAVIYGSEESSIVVIMRNGDNNLFGSYDDVANFLKSNF